MIFEKISKNENKEVVLGSLQDGTEFWFALVKFHVVQRSEAYPDLIHCKIEDQDHFCYITAATLVTLRL